LKLIERDLIDVFGARLAHRTGLGVGGWLLVWTSSASAATNQLNDAFQTILLVNL